jgi:hypothetical protein
MKQITYLQHHDVPYVGKHAKKWYAVHRMLGPGGPSETIPVYGLDAAKDSVKDIYGYKIIAPDGRVVCES